MDWVREALRASHADEKQYHEEIMAELQKRCEQLQHRIDAMYVDKLDGRTTAEYFDQRSAEWRTEQAEIRRKIEAHVAGQSRLHGREHPATRTG